MQPSEQSIYTYEPHHNQHACRVCGGWHFHTHTFAEVEPLVEQGETIKAVFLCRHTTNYSLSEAAHYVNGLLDTLS